MISRERFEELVKNADKNSIIWGVTDYTYHKSKPELKIDYFELCNMPTFYKNNIDKLFENYCNTEFFETKEEAEWYLEFGNITRTEMLTLPTWEEIEKLKSGKPYKVYFNDKQFFFASRLIIEVGKYDTYGEQIEQYFCEGTTKENYLEACRIAKKLFLGEEV